MTVQKNIYEMSNRELITYKKNLRRKIVIRRRMMLLFMTCFLIIIGAFSYNSFKSSAHSTEDEMQFKYYTNITVEYGETLWEIADRYVDYEQYRDKAEYIREVKSINHLDAEADIKAGQYLIVPYFSNEFVK